MLLLLATKKLLVNFVELANLLIRLNLAKFILEVLETCFV